MCIYLYILPKSFSCKHYYPVTAPTGTVGSYPAPSRTSFTVGGIFTLGRHCLLQVIERSVRNGSTGIFIAM